MSNIQSSRDVKNNRKQAADTFEITVDEKGRIILPANISDSLSLIPGTSITLEQTSQGLLLQRSDPLLTKVYIEPTNACNLNCKTCVRNSWDEPTGFMDIKTYRTLIESLRSIPSLQKISLWGIGEPLFHPDIVEMVALAKGLGVNTQMITNAHLLDEMMAKNLIKAGLDSIVFSVDGTTTQTNDQIRSGSDISIVKENVARLRQLRDAEDKTTPEIGLEFVVMRQNVGELKNLRRLSDELGARFIVISNLLPYSEDLKNETLYNFCTEGIGQTSRSRWSPEIILPPIDLHPEVAEGLAKLLGYSYRLNIPKLQTNNRGRFCKFVEEGSVAISFDGEVSPCIALMHSYDCFILGRKKHFKRSTLGNINRQDIAEIWNNDAFIELRRSVKRFDFSPCAQCGGCELGEKNEQDCFGNRYPVCGDCLWAQGIIQCP